jgi:hypothetical protein
MPDPADTAQGGTTSPVGSGPSGRSFNSPTVTTTSSPVSSTTREGGGTTQGDSAKSSAAGAGADAGDGEGGATPTTTSSTTSPTTGQSTRTNNPVSPGARTPDQPAGTSSGAPTNTTASGGTNFKSNSTTKVSDPSRTNPNAGGYPQGGLNQVTPGQANAGAASNLTNGVGGLVNASLNGGLTAPSTIADAITGTAPPSVYGAPSFGAMAGINPAYTGTGMPSPYDAGVGDNLLAGIPAAPTTTVGKMQDRVPGAPGFGQSDVLASPVAAALGIPGPVAGATPSLPPTSPPPASFAPMPPAIPPAQQFAGYIDSLFQQPAMPPAAPVTTAAAPQTVAPGKADSLALPSLMQQAAIAADPTLAGKIPDRLIGEVPYGPEDQKSPSYQQAAADYTNPPVQGPTPPAGVSRYSTHARLEVPNKVAGDKTSRIGGSTYSGYGSPASPDAQTQTYLGLVNSGAITPTPAGSDDVIDVPEPPGGLPDEETQIVGPGPADPAGPVGPSQQAGQPQTPGELTNRIGYEYGKAKQGLHDLPGKLMESLLGGKFTAGPDLHALQQLRGGGGGIMEGFPQPVDENRDGYDDKSGESIREIERRRYAQQFQLLMSAFM